MAKCQRRWSIRVNLDHPGIGAQSSGTYKIYNDSEETD